MSDKPSYEDLQQRIITLEKQTSIYKTALKNLKKKSTLAEKIIAESNCIIVGLDKNHRIVLFNDAAEKITGFKPEEVRGKDWFKLFLKPDLHKEMKNVWKSAWGVRFHTYENPIQTKNNDEKIISWKSTGLYDSDDETEHILISFGEDVTEHRLAEKKLKKFAAVIEQAAEEVIITDAKGNIQYVNPRFEKNTGFTKEEVFGKTPKILKSGFCDDLFYKNIWLSVLEKKIWKGKIVNKSKDGRQLIYDAIITSILDSSTDEITAFVSVRRDITEQEKLKKQLSKAGRMEAIGTIAGGIAHDFNTILTGIMGYAELVIEDLEEINSSPATIERVENMIKSAERAKNLISQILRFSRSDDEDIYPVNVSLVIKEVINLLRASMPTTIRISISLASDSFVMSNSINIHQIMMNICTNAKDAMEETGGFLNISTTNVILKETDLAAYQDDNITLKPGMFCLISIEDTGKGMDSNIINKIMEPFFTTKLRNNGTGLGLFVVHGIVKRLGGFINVTSKKNAGTKFNVYLPVCEKSDKKNDLTMENDIKGGTESIICVDDDPTGNIIYKELLSGLGYKVITFNSSCRAFDFFKTNHDKCDLVIADITMPDMTGDTMVKKMRDVKPEIPVIFCTAGTGSNSDMNERIKKIKPNTLLLKPVRLKKLALVVRDVLDGKIKWQEF